MKRLTIVVVAFGCVLAGGIAVYAQCGPNGCSSAAQVVHVQSQPGYRWVPVPGEPDQVALYFGNLQVGGYNYATGFYRPIVGGTWRQPSKSPIAPPLNGGGGPSHGYSFGVSTSHLTGRERYWSGGESFTRDQFENLVGAEIRDDSKAPCVTGVSKDAGGRQKMLADWEVLKTREPATAKVRSQFYDYSHPVNKAMLSPNQLDQDKNFQRTGNVVLAQAAGDEKTGRSAVTAIYDYAFDTLAEAVRIAAPDKDKPAQPKLPSLQNVPTDAYIAGGLAALIGIGYMRRRKHS